MTYKKANSMLAYELFLQTINSPICIWVGLHITILTTPLAKKQYKIQYVNINQLWGGHSTNIVYTNDGSACVLPICALHMTSLCSRHIIRHLVYVRDENPNFHISASRTHTVCGTSEHLREYSCCKIISE